MKISVVIPSYNSLENLTRLVNSVLCQSYEDYEIVISDDSSDNQIEDYIKSLDNPKISYFHHLPSLGSPKNWNFAIKKAQGDYVKIMHHDDWFSSNDALDKFVKLMDENPDCDFGYSKSVNVDLASGKIKKRHAEKYVKALQKNCFELFVHNRIGAPSVVIFRNGVNLFFDEKLKWVVDIDFYIALLIKNPKIAFLKEELINIGISTAQTTNECVNNANVDVYEYFYMYDKYYEYLKNFKDAKKYLASLLKKYKIKDEAALKTIIGEDIRTIFFS